MGLFCDSTVWYARLVKAVEDDCNEGVSALLEEMPQALLYDRDVPLPPATLKTIWKICFSSQQHPGGVDMKATLCEVVSDNAALSIWGELLAEHTRYWLDQVFIYLLLESRPATWKKDSDKIALTPFGNLAGMVRKDPKRRARDLVFLEMNRRAFDKTQSWIKDKIKAGAFCGK